MITKDQENYLKTIPESAIAVIKPWDAKAAAVAERLLAQIKSVVPDLEVIFTGALALGIAGQNDVDFSVLDSPSNFNRHLPALIKVLGEPQKVSKENIRWEIKKDGYEVDVYMADKNSERVKEHKRTFELLKTDSKLLTEYEKLKNDSNGLPFREYMRRKYEFYNRILDIKVYK